MNQYTVEAPLPPELLGRKRNEVKLLGINRRSGKMSSNRFDEITSMIKANDLLIFNNSKLVPASLNAYFPEIKKYGKIHIGNSRYDGDVIVEPRPRGISEQLHEGDTVGLLGTSEVLILEKRHEDFGRFFWARNPGHKDPLQIANEFGSFIRYDHIPFDIPEIYYETSFGKYPGSVEFPSASRPFTNEILGRITNNGARIVEITLHCNLGSLEPQEFVSKNKLLDESFHIPDITSEIIQDTKKKGGRIIAVGTSVVRALESSCADGVMKSGSFRTELFISPGYEFQIVDSIITGMHEDLGSHIGMISAFSGVKNLERGYLLGRGEGYFWHEFGDLAFIY